MPKNPLDCKFGRKIRLSRRAIGLTQAKVSAGMGLTRTAVVHMESGSRPVKLNEVVSLAKMLNTTPEMLLADVFNEKRWNEEYYD